MTGDSKATNSDFVSLLDSKLKTLPRSLLLSQVVGPSPAPGQPHAYVPPTAAMRSEARQLTHNRALQDIASARFAFPTEKYRDYKTYINHPRRTMGVQMPGGGVAYPDIVVVQHPENNARIVAEVETNESVRESVAVYEWGPYAELAPLYLYVPVGKGDEALSLCRRFEVAVVGIRTWRYNPAQDEIELNDHFTVPSGPEDLLPKLLRSS
ncbi:MAG TPA: hypothetical protein VFO59_08945 [Dehalococcoidia bacterium]|jgi:hypothetical protein|nr:hypothetical protein [Dehalococcoidia bacterium]